MPCLPVGIGASVTQRPVFTSYPSVCTNVLSPVLHSPPATMMSPLYSADAPPLRTVQRRLQKLVSDGVLSKRGARKNAMYVLADREVPE